ncbi:MAG: redoxin family protein [Chloroflexi bacterium]|nr:redoxin family protein [Chloroflexota bacterium]
MSFQSQFLLVRRVLPAVLLLAVLAGSACAPRLTGQSEGQKAQGGAWLDVPLKDAVTERPFKLSDFKGSIVVIETMAIWCSTCTRQQIEIRQAKSQLGSDVVSVSLDVDPNENEVMLSKHARSNGFNWAFAVSPVVLSQQLGKAFGENILNPAATPVVILDRDQSAHPLRFGLKSAPELAREIAKYR